MVYFVKHGDMHSTQFKAFIGMLTGDPASPILWNLFLADLSMMPDTDDVFLAAIRISLRSSLTTIFDIGCGGRVHCK
jgi:hypothetical protein